MKGALPHRLTAESGELQIEWVWSDGGRFTESFFHDTVARLRHTNPANVRCARPRTPVAALHDFPPGVPVVGIIFHVSRCGSTLLSRMLAAVPRNLVASEPQIIDELLRLPQRDPSIAEGELIRLLRGAVAALGQPPAGGARRMFLKVDCWHLFSLPLIQRAFPKAKLLFVYRDPIEVLVSLMRKPSLTLVRDTIAPEHLGLTADERDALSREEHAAAIVGAFYRTALRHRASLFPIPYEQVSEIAMNGLPGITQTHEERESMRVAAAFDAKNPSERFVPDGTDKRAEATPALLTAAARWAEPAYRAWTEAGITELRGSRNSPSLDQCHGKTNS